MPSPTYERNLFVGHGSMHGDYAYSDLLQILSALHEKPRFVSEDNGRRGDDIAGCRGRNLRGKRSIGTSHSL